MYVSPLLVYLLSPSAFPIKSYSISFRQVILSLFQALHRDKMDVLADSVGGYPAEYLKIVFLNESPI